MNRAIKIALGVVVGAAVVAGGMFYAIARENTTVNNVPVVVTPLPADTTDSAAFKNLYPREYDSYQKNLQTLPPALKYHGSEKKHSRLDDLPFLKVMWNGYPFSTEYNEARGHLYALDDTLGGNGTVGTKRITQKTMLTCMYCKSPEVPGLLQKMGDSFFSTHLLEGNNKDLFKHPIGCADCHDPQTMALRVTRPAFVEAMARRGVDVSKATRQEMRSYVCAQCHVTYFFNPEDKNRVTFPWDKGFNPSDLYEAENQLGKNFADFTHPQSGTPIMKARHPEFEMFQGSVHQAAGLSCADCHMPYVKEGNTKISSHWLTSPMRTFQQSCGTCHKQSEKEMQERVLYIQDRVRDAENKAGAAVTDAINAIEAAKKAGASDQELAEAREMHRRGQYYLDLVVSENSTGFHNPEKALKALADSLDLLRQAQIKANQIVAGKK